MIIMFIKIVHIPEALCFEWLKNYFIVEEFLNKNNNEIAKLCYANWIVNSLERGNEKF